MARRTTTPVRRVATAAARIYLILASLMFVAGMIGGAVIAYSGLSP